jgi:glycosyltransferase involved in cell wall biosynthesis
MKKSVSVVIFAFNEETTIGSAIKETVEALTSLDRKFEIIVLDDGSTDNSNEIAEAMAEKYAPLVRVIRHENNRGFGAVFSSGMNAVKNDIVSFIAGDGQPIPAIYYKRCLPPLDEHSMVVGRIPTRKDPSLVLFFAGAERFLMRLLFPGVPKIVGPFMFHRSLLDELNLYYRDREERGWVIQIELLIKAMRNGHTFAMVEVERRMRVVHRSRAATWPNAVRMAWLLMTLWWMIRANPGSKNED